MRKKQDLFNGTIIELMVIFQNIDDNYYKKLRLIIPTNDKVCWNNQMQRKK